jgi:hypothetical protein
VLGLEAGRALDGLVRLDPVEDRVRLRLRVAEPRQRLGVPAGPAAHVQHRPVGGKWEVAREERDLGGGLRSRHPSEKELEPGLRVGIRRHLGLSWADWRSKDIP